MTNSIEQDEQRVVGLRLAVLMTCYNRVESTIQCIKTINAQAELDVNLDLFLVDDGSTDGTTQAVLDVRPNTTVLDGDGNLFWCGGMHWAFSEAIQGDYDFYLWLNDDTNLEFDALARLIQTFQEASKQHAAVIVVGSVYDPETGQFSYGGWRRKPGKFGLNSWEKTPPNNSSILCDTMNGNCVLIPRTVVERVGNIDSVFRQGIGDIDYGLRAIKSGCVIIIAPGYYGACKRNDGLGLWCDKNLSLLSRWRKLLGPKGFPIKSWGTFTYRHKGPLWIFAWMAPYVIFWFDALVKRKH